MATLTLQPQPHFIIAGHLFIQCGVERIADGHLRQQKRHDGPSAGSSKVRACQRHRRQLSHPADLSACRPCGHVPSRRSILRCWETAWTCDSALHLHHPPFNNKIDGEHHLPCCGAGQRLQKMQREACSPCVSRGCLSVPINQQIQSYLIARRRCGSTCRAWGPAWVPPAPWHPPPLGQTLAAWRNVLFI